MKTHLCCRGQNNLSTHILVSSCTFWAIKLSFLLHNLSYTMITSTPTLLQHTFLHIIYRSLILLLSIILLILFCFPSFFVEIAITHPPIFHLIHIIDHLFTFDHHSLHPIFNHTNLYSHHLFFCIFPPTYPFSTLVLHSLYSSLTYSHL